MTISPRGLNGIYNVFILTIIFSALGAYSIFGVPIPWLALVAIISLSIWIWTRTTPRIVPGFTFLLVFTFFAIVTTLLSSLLEDASNLMPPKATTPYMIYVGLRILNILAFICAVVTTYWICEWKTVRKITHDIALIGLAVAAYSFYVYLAQVYGFPEIPRTRAGTDGGEQSTVFTYAFHRAMGSFREPSHLAEWLVFPFFLALAEHRLAWLKSMIITASLLLTGSLTGLGGVAFGFGASTLFQFNRLSANLGRLFRFALPLLFAAGLFGMVVSSGKDYRGLFEVLWSRVEPIINETDLQKSNRDYVYKYLDQHEASLFGEGLGNANLVFTAANKFDSMGSFLSLYISTYYSLGIVGLILLLGIFLYPLFIHYSRNRGRADGNFMFILAAYFAWLFMFFAHSEELNLQFGVVFGILMYCLKMYSRRQSPFQESKNL